MRTITVGIAENTDYNIKQLVDCIEDTPNMEVAFAETRGDNVAKLCLSHKPDVIVIDTALPYKDGFAILEEINSMELDKYPVVILTTSAGTDAVVRKALGLGAQYVMMKPFTPENVARRIQELTSHDFSKATVSELKLKDAMDFANLARKNELEKRITNALLEMRFPARRKGFKYMRSAIYTVIIDPSSINAITKEIYPKVAKEYNTSSDCVEKSLRDIIASTWNECSDEYKLKYFNYPTDRPIPKPTNSEFIAVMYEQLKDF